MSNAGDRSVIGWGAAVHDLQAAARRPQPATNNEQRTTNNERCCPQGSAVPRFLFKA